MKKFLKYLFLVCLLFQFSINIYAETKWITKKKSINKIEIEKVEKRYADGFLTKLQCIKAKSKLLKIPKISKTICDNVKVKVAKNEEKNDFNEEINKIKTQLEVSKKKNQEKTWISKKKQEKKKKKEFKEKEKDLSKDTKSWITKKKKEKKKTIVKEKYYNSLAELPISEFYFYAIDEYDREIIGYANQDANSKYMEVGNRKFRKGNEGKAYIVNTKVSCDIYSEVDKAKSSRVYMGNVTMICSDNQQFIGGWIQNGENGRGIATSENGKNSFEFIFSMNRDTAIAIAGKEPPKETTIAKTAKKKTDIYAPEVSVAETIEVDGDFILKGKVFDGSDKCTSLILEIDGKRQKINEDCSFNKSLNSDNVSLVIVEAYDLQGNKSETKNVKIVSKFTSNEKYYALIIGNNNYKYIDKLSAAVNDAEKIADMLENKYGFEVELLRNANSKEMHEAIINLRNKVTMDDNLLIYYAGHGMRDNDAIPKQAYWIPIDGGKSLDGNWINTRTIESYVSGIKAKHILLMVDSCYASTFKGSDSKFATELQVNDTDWVKKMLNTRTRLLITSGTDQPVLDEVIDNHSWFAYLFLRFLDENVNYINATSMFEKLKKKHGSFNQNPKLNRLENIGDKNGDFFFFAKN